MVEMNESVFKMSTEALAEQLKQICDENSHFEIIIRENSRDGKINGKIQIKTMESVDDLTVHTTFDEVRAGTKQVGEHGLKQLYKIDHTASKVYNALVLAGIKQN